MGQEISQETLVLFLTYFDYVCVGFLGALQRERLICFASSLLSSLELSDTELMSHDYEPSPEPLHNSAK